MERMLAVTAHNPVAAGAGVIAMLCLATWPLFRTRWTMLMTYMGNNVAFVVHYALLGQWTAVAMNGLMGVQTVVAILLIRLPRLRLVYYALMPVLALASLVTWQDYRLCCRRQRRRCRRSAVCRTTKPFCAFSCSPQHRSGQHTM
jgi:hypothetical protein